MASTERTVVVADDDEAMRRLTGILLQRAGGFRLVGEAATGPETIAVVERERPDLLLLDHQMPGSEGFSVLHELAARKLTTSTVLLSGHDPETHRAQALRNGAIEFLQKSADLQRVVASLRELGQRLASMSNSAS